MLKKYLFNSDLMIAETIATKTIAVSAHSTSREVSANFAILNDLFLLYMNVLALFALLVFLNQSDFVIQIIIHCFQLTIVRHKTINSSVVTMLLASL